METNGFFLNHVPDGSSVVYEFHKDRRPSDFDYHQIYYGSTPIKSALLAPEHLNYALAAQKVREKYTDCKNRMYLEWDNPMGGELQPPAIFIDFAPWWKRPEQNQPSIEVWNAMLLETAQAAGFDFTLADIPECPNIGSFHKITYGFFPSRDHSVPWFRVACTKTVEECPEFAKQMGFSTKWFEKFDLVKHCASCLISFNISKNGVSKPAAEMILKDCHQHNLIPEFKDFSEIYQQGRQLILDNQGEYLHNLNLCHFKVNLTDESFEKQEAKMYMFAYARL